MSLERQLDDYRIHFGGEMDAEKAAEVVGEWRAAAAEKASGEDVELAGAFQRHYTSFGTGLPPNFCLVLTPTEVLAFKFDPRNPRHPLAVKPSQLKKVVARWPRSAVRASGLEPGRMALGFTLEVSDGSDTQSIPCRTPRIAVNPAAAVILQELGAGVPAN
jgi:hypothetical protein